TAAATVDPRWRRRRAREEPAAPAANSTATGGNRGVTNVPMRAGDVDLVRDRALVEAWQAGDGTAFDDLYRRYFDRLRAFCRKRVGDPVEADDIAQEAFLRALQALPRLTGERRFYPW